MKTYKIMNKKNTKTYTEFTTLAYAEKFIETTTKSQPEFVAKNGLHIVETEG